jgi:hypothetical protein
VITGIAGVLALSAWLLLWPLWSWYHIPRFTDMSETEVETYVRNRILGSSMLKAKVRSWSTEPGDGPDVVESEHIITDWERIQRLAEEFRVLSNRGRIGPVATNMGIFIRCDERFSIWLPHEDEVFLPLPKDEWGSCIVQVPLSFLDELGDQLNARRMTDDMKIRSLLSELENPNQAEEAANALAKLGDHALYYLTLLLKDKHGDSAARMWAAVALRDMGPAAKEAIPILTEVLNNEDEEIMVRKYAAEAIEAIGPLDD